jgi:hypothetical protein
MVEIDYRVARLRKTLIIIILATLPCYLLGTIVLFVADKARQLPTATPTNSVIFVTATPAPSSTNLPPTAYPTPSATTSPTATATFTVTFTPTVTYTITPTFTVTLTPAPIDTPTPTDQIPTQVFIETSIPQ